MTTKRPSGTLRVSVLPELLRERLEDPGGVLELLVTSLTKSEHNLELWAQLHDAAVRDDATPDLALAYDKVCGEKRIKLIAPADRAVLFLHASRFFGDVLGDADGATDFARKVLECVPGHTEAITTIERWLDVTGDQAGLAKLYVDAAVAADDPEAKIARLRQAAALVEGLEGAEPVCIDVNKRILRLAPGDESAISSLVNAHCGAGRHREAAKVLEDAIRAADAPASAEVLEHRRKLVDLYTADLGEPQRSIAHLEALLDVEPGDERALSVAEGLLEHRIVAPRAAGALSDAYQKLGRIRAASDMLTLELKLVRGPRRIEVQRRLAVLRQDELDDPAGALELLGPAVAGDPGNDDLRRRFVELSVDLDQPREAAGLLERAMRSARDGDIRARVGVDVGALYRKLGDVQRAQKVLEKVVSTANDASAALGAARHLAEIYSEAGDLEQLGRSLAIVVQHEPDAQARTAAARRLTRLCDDGVLDQAVSTPAWEALVESPWADEALRRLEPLYESASNHVALADVLDRRAARSKNPDEARELAFRAAELRSTRIRDRAAALAAWRALVAKYGPSQEAHARLLPLLEQERQWSEAADVLDAEIGLVPEEERPGLMARVAQLRLSRLGDTNGALDAFRAALRANPQEPTSRVAVERMLRAGEARLAAADILEPIYQAEEAGTGLVRVLQTRGELAPSVDERLRAFESAVEVAESIVGDPELALGLAGQALTEAVDRDRESLMIWLDRVQELSAAGGDPATRSQALARALGDHEVDSEEMLALARAAGEAQVVSGDLAGAIDSYRKALAYSPASGELLQRMDELLAQQGSPEERLELYRSALEQPNDVTRRRELLHAMGNLQRRELGDLPSAVATWRLALQDDPRDLTAHQCLVDALGAQQDWEALYEELGRALELQTGERKIATLRRMAEVRREQGEPAQALAHYRELMLLGRQPDELLAAVERYAQEHDDAATLRDALEQRVLGATEPDEQADLLERLGRVQALQLGDAEAAAQCWRRGARLSEGAAANDERALRLYERVLHVSPSDREAAERLVELYARAGDWTKIPDAFEVLLGTSGESGNAVAQLLSLEGQALGAGAAEVYVKLVDSALARVEGSGDQQRRLTRAQARALETDEKNHQRVVAIYRELLADEQADAEQVAESFERYLSEGTAPEQWVADRRWLFQWRAEHATNQAGVLVRWAMAEEETYRNATGALELYEKVVALDADRTDALSEVARLRAQLGDPDGALRALRSLREHSHEDDRAAIDVKIAGVLLEQLERPQEALDVAESVLESSPTDPDALGIVNRTLGHPATQARAAELLEKASESAPDPQHRVQVLETLLATSEDRPELGEARRRWYARLLETSSEDPESALQIALRGAQEYSDAEDLWDAAERFTRRLGDPGPVAEAYAHALEAELTPDAAEALGRKMVEFHEEWFEDPDRVIGLLQRVITLCPSAGWAFDRLKLAFNAAGRWEELFDLYDEALDRTTDDGERTDLLREAAMAAKDFAADPDRAIGYLERYNSLVPGDPRIESSLERLYEREARTRPLIELLSGQLKKADGGERLVLRARVAALWLDLEKPGRAVELIEAALEESGFVPGLVDLLERVMALPASRETVYQDVKAEDEATLSVRDRAADLLRSHYEAVEAQHDVARVMELRLESVTGTAERVRRLTELVSLRLGELDDPVGAFENVGALVRLQPASPAHRELLADLAERTGAEEARAALAEQVARDVDVVGLRAQLLLEAATVREQRLGDPAGAIALYLETVDLAEHERAAGLAATRALDGLLEEAARAGERCTVLELRADWETDAEARRTALGNAAIVAADELGDLPRAIRAWRLRLEDDPRDLPALDGLCDVLGRAEQHAELIQALETRAGLLSDPQAARTDRVRVARLHAEQLGNAAAAIDAWRVVRGHHGQDLESFDALRRLLEGEQRWSELGAVLEQEAEHEQDEGRRTTLYLDLGELHRRRTLQPDHALRAYVSAHDWSAAMDVAGSEGLTVEMGLRVRRDLLQLAVDAWQEGSGEEAARAAAEWAVDALAQKLREVGEHQEAVSVLLGGARHPFAVERTREWRRVAACTCSDQLQDGVSAIEIFAELFAETPNDSVASESVTRFALLLEQAERYSDLVALWEQQADCRAASGDRASAAALWARAAELAETKLGDLERATADYRRGAGLGGEGALEALARIYEAGRRQRRLVEVLEWLCAQSSRQALGARSLRLAEAYLAVGEPQRALARLEHAAGIALDGAPVRKRLAELYRRARDWAKLAELLATEAVRAPDAKTRLSLLREAAGLHRQQRQDPGAAVPLLQQAVELDGDDPALRLELSEALEQGGRYEEAIEILRQQLDRYGSRRPKDRALVHFQLAKALLAAGDRDQALTELSAANKIDPAHPGILQKLARLAFEEGQLDRAERMFRALLLVLKPGEESDTASRAEALLDLSEIAVLQEDPVRSTEFIESAFESALESAHEANRLEVALRSRGRTELLARSIEARLEHAVAPPDAARALADLVMLHAAHLASGERGKERYLEQAQAIQQGLDRQDSTDDEAWEALSRVYDCLGESGAEAEVLERRVARWVQRDDEPPNADPFYRLAEVRLADAATRDRGLELLERALAIQPDEARAETSLRSALEEDPANERALRLLEQLVRRSGNEEALAEVLGLLIRLPGATSELIREGAALANRLEDDELVEDMLKSALESDLVDEDAVWVRCELAELRLRAGDPRSALDLREQAAKYAEPEAARELLLEVASAATQEDEDLPRAARIYAQLLEADPAEQQVWEPLLNVYRKLDAKEELVELIDQTAALVDSPGGRARLRLEQANILLEAPDRMEEAAQILQEIVDEDPGQATAAILLSDILEKTGRSEELVSLLNTQLDTAKDRQDLDAIAGVSDRLIKLLEEQERIDDALDVANAALDWDARDEGCLRAILRLTERKGDDYLVGDAIEGLLRVVTEREAAELATRLIALRRELGDAEGIERALELGFRACPSDTGLRDGIVALRKKREDWAGLAELLRTALEVTPDDEVLVAELLDAYRAGGDYDQALEVLDGLIDKEGSDDTLLREKADLLTVLGRDAEALAALEQAHEVSGKYATQLIEALGRAIGSADSAGERALTLRLVELLEASGDVDGVRERLRYLAEVDPNDREVLRRLAHLELGSENWEGAVLAYVQLVPLEEGEDLVAASLELAAACDRAQRPADARAGLEQALAVAPGNVEVRERLRQLYEAIGATRELAHLLQQDAAQESDVAQCMAYLLRAGELLLATPGELDEAVRVLEEARSLDPNSVDGVVLLSRAYTALGRGDDAMGLLQATAAEHHGRRVKEMSGVYLEISRMQLEEGFLSDAMQSLSKAFDMDLRNAQLGMHLGELALEIEEWEAAGRAFRQVAMMKPYNEKKGEGANSDQKANANYYLAWLALQTGDTRKAKLLASKALAANSNHEQARALLDQIENG